MKRGTSKISNVVHTLLCFLCKFNKPWNAIGSHWITRINTDSSGERMTPHPWHIQPPAANSYIVRLSLSIFRIVPLVMTSVVEFTTQSVYNPKSNLLKLLTVLSKITFIDFLYFQTRDITVFRCFKI